MSDFFSVSWQDTRTRARIGILHTPHGTVSTPAFVPVGTQATVKSLTPEELKELGVQLFFVNTYHAFLRPGIVTIEKHGGLHKFMHWSRNIITDSGGFQIFSLGKKRYVNTALSEAAVLDRARFTKKQSKREGLKDMVYPDEYRPVNELVRLDDDGVTFTSHWDGSPHRFTPEISIDIQKRLGSDLVIAFDECAPYPTTHEYAEKALRRTEAWLTRSIAAFRDTRQKAAVRGQSIYGVIQGSVYEDLRKKSAADTAKAEVSGIAIGGVSVGESKAQMKNVLDWVVPILPNDKPRHLLGVGEIDDVFTIIESGIDTFDCVQPTRLARMGQLYVYPNVFPKSPHLFIADITKAAYQDDVAPVDSACSCYSCTNFSRSYIHHLFRVKELLAYRLATIHNIFTFNRLVRDISEKLPHGTYKSFKSSFFQK